MQWLTGRPVKFHVWHKCSLALARLHDACMAMTPRPAADDAAYQSVLPEYQDVLPVKHPE